MKKLIYTTALLLATAFAANAQHADKSIRIENVRTELTPEALDIHFMIQASDLHLNCEGQLKLEFAVESADRRLILPVVVYSGKQRYRYEQRRAALSDGYTTEPYHIYKGVKKNRSYELEYTISIPYYSWMEHASVTYREYMHDCSGDNLTSNGVLLADLNPVGTDDAPVYTTSHPRKPANVYLPNLVSFLDPQVEEPKVRASMIELNIGYPVNRTDVQQAFGNNAGELRRVDSLVNIFDNPLLTVTGVNIKGYASPEGSYSSNARLAKGRSEGFKEYLTEVYPQNGYIRNASVTWVPEDWEGLARLVQAGNMPNKGEVLSVVLDGSMAPDTKEQLLQKIGQWSYVYKPMLDNMYPKLRRIELWVDYMVQKFDNNKARELIYTDPHLLSLGEIYYVARSYEHGSRQYLEVYEIAAQQFPNDLVANNNAAAALLQQGLADQAFPYLQKIENDPASYINFGTYYLIKGDKDRAADYYNKAKEAGNPQAEQNLQIINPMR